jgi:hypothetical protein
MPGRQPEKWGVGYPVEPGDPLRNPPSANAELRASRVAGHPLDMRCPDRMTAGPAQSGGMIHV